MLVAGQLVAWTRGKDWLSTFNFHLSIVIGAGLVALGMLCWLHWRRPFEAQPDARHVALDEAARIAPEEQPKSVGETLRAIGRSRVLLCLAVVIFADYVAFNLVEVLWKDQLYRLFPDPRDFCAYTGRVTFWTGAVTGLGALLIAPRALQHWNWTTTAIVTPLVLLVLSVFFFFFGMYGMLPLAVGAGALHSVLARTAQWSFGGPSKELAYVSLPPDLQTHGKAFVDGLCPTLGKSTGAFTQQGLLLFAPTLAATAPYCAFIVLGMLLASMTAVITAGRTLAPAGKRAEAAS